MKLPGTYSENLFYFTAILMVALSAACDSSLTSQNPGVQFTYSGITMTGFTGKPEACDVLVSSDKAQSLVEGKPVLNSLNIDFEWIPGQEYDLYLKKYDLRLQFKAPERPGIALAGKVDFGAELFQMKANAREETPTSVEFSSDAEHVYLGTNLGRVLVISLSDGSVRELLSRQSTFIRRLEYVSTNSGNVLVVGEQSPTGSVIAYALESGNKAEEKWRFNSADDIGEGKSDPNDPFAWAHMPGIYRIVKDNSGNIFVISNHSVGVDGPVAAASRIYKLDVSTGEKRWVWPENANHAGTTTWFDTDETGSRVASCSSLADGRGYIAVLDGNTGGLIYEFEIQPLTPHLGKVTFWKGVDISGDGKTACAISSDGRAWIINVEESSTQEIVLGEPIIINNLPLLVTGSAARAGRDLAVFATGTTYLPWEIAEGQRPSQPHPSANTIFGLSADRGEVRWRVILPNMLQGMRFIPGEDMIVAGYASDPVFSPGGGSGLLILGMSQDGGETLGSYLLEGAVMHGSPVISAETGLIVLVEVTQRDDVGEKLTGNNALHILRW